MPKKEKSRSSCLKLAKTRTNIALVETDVAQQSALEGHEAKPD